MVKSVNSKEFLELRKSESIIVVDFFADWCTPCKMMEPILDKVSEQIDDSVKFAKINVDKHIDIAEKYNITTIPTILILKNGEILDRTSGLCDENNLYSLIKKYI